MSFIPAKLRRNPYRRQMTHRELYAGYVRKSRLCVWCGSPVPKRRQSWCSPICIQEYQIVAGHHRQFLWGRDHGVCRACGMDAGALDRVVRRLKFADREWLLRELTEPGASVPVCGYRRSTWDADHIVPVEQGGGQCGLDGFQTLCVWCHQVKTAIQAAGKRPGRTT